MSPQTLNPNERALFATNIALAIPPGFYGQIAPRSSLALRGIDTKAGVIDSDYRGELKVLLHNASSEPFVAEPGDRIAQLILHRIGQPIMLQVEELPTTARGGGGFGSTGA